MFFQKFIFEILDQIKPFKIQITMAFNVPKSYCCVKFLEKDGSSRRTVIPSNWVKNGMMYWSNSLNATKQWKACCEPNKSWPYYKVIKVLLRGGKT